jgi:heme o synthase
MKLTGTNTYSVGAAMQARIADYTVLVKMRLSLLVVFSSFMGYLLAAAPFLPIVALLVVAGGLLVTFAANAMNQVLEKEYDRLMRRTMSRPLVTGRLSVSSAVLFAGLTLVAGTLILATINVWAAFFGMLSFVLYAFVYTPLKRIHPIAVLVGAIPGAMPVFIGWVSGAGTLGHEGLLLFSLQFFWQFPHFWAIAWLGHEDYNQAGFRLLPEANGQPGSQTAFQSLLYAACLLVLPLMHFSYGFTGWLGLSLLMLAGGHYTRAGYRFYLRRDEASARKLLYASFLYLPIALLALYLDKLLLP